MVDTEYIVFFRNKAAHDGRSRIPYAGSRADRKNGEDRGVFAIAGGEGGKKRKC